MKKLSIVSHVKACRMVKSGCIGPAASVPLYLLIDASKFDRATVAAMSIKDQRQQLATARQMLKQGQPEVAALYIVAYKRERAAYNNLFTFGDK